MLDTELDKKEIHEGDVVELVVDLPEYDLKRGQRGVVITEFEEHKAAYDIEFEDEEGNFLGFAYSVKPSHITNISREAYDHGMKLLDEGRRVDAERELQRAIELNPNYKRDVLNSIVDELEETKAWEVAILKLRLLLRLVPEYEHARNNLTIAYLNYGIQEANQGDVEYAITFLHHSIEVNISPNLVPHIQANIAAAYTNLGIQEHQSGNHEKTVSTIGMACVCFPSENTRRNLAIAYAYLARFYRQSGNYEGAVLAYQRAEEIGLLTPELLNDYGLTLVFAGRLDEAARALERALELAPASDIIKENLAKLMSNEIKETFVSQEIPEFVKIPTIAQSFQQAA